MPFRRFSRPIGFAAALALAATAGLVIAQVDDPDQGLAPADSSGSFEVGGIDVDVTGKSAESARFAGWRVAQRKGWAMLAQRMGVAGPALSDGALDGVVSGIVVENEQIGPNRYIARLGVLFSRTRAGAILGVTIGAARSAPMLTIPIEVSGGVASGFERKTAWQEAWARYRTVNSTIDYVRPGGTGADGMLLNFGQTGRPGRGWWRVVLDQYGANDILVPKVTLRREWPGGPIIGMFEARHGPDNRLITQFSLRVDRGDALPVLLDAGVKRLDESYQAALRSGMLAGDPSLAFVPPVTTPTPTETPTGVVPVDLGIEGAAPPGVTSSVVSVQIDTPTSAAVTSSENALQSVPGVRSAITTSLAIGGVSVVRVAFDGDVAVLRAALEARGWSVAASGSTLRIRRSAPPSQSGQAPPPADNSTG